MRVQVPEVDNIGSSAEAIERRHAGRNLSEAWNREEQGYTEEKYDAALFHRSSSIH